MINGADWPTTNPADPPWYQREADTFIEIMREMVPDLRLDYSPESIGRLDRFIAREFDPPGSKHVGESLPIGVGCYIGEVVIRTLGGFWSKAGLPEVNAIGQIKAIFPIQKAVKRFKNGAEDSLVSYFDTIARYAHK